MTTPQFQCHPHSQRPFKGTGGLYRASSTAEAARAMHSDHSDHANQAAVRRLIPPPPRRCSLAPSVTTPLYNTTVCQALRQTLRSRRSRVNFRELRYREVRILGILGSWSRKPETLKMFIRTFIRG